MAPMQIRYFQRGFNYSQDGPGNRLVYHLQGCNMRCPWCANPEGLSPRAGQAVEIDALLEEIRRSKAMFFDGGGVTFTGGEPTMQFDALKTLLQALHRESIHTAIETNASHPRLPELIPYLDYVMADLKQPLPAAHLACTGVALDCVLENLRTLSFDAKQLLIHIPLVNGYNTSPEAMSGFAHLLSSLKTDRMKVEVLRYHEYGRDKWARLGCSYTVDNGFVTDEQYDRCVQLLQEQRLTVVNT